MKKFPALTAVIISLTPSAVVRSKYSGTTPSAAARFQERHGAGVSPCVVA